MIFCLCDLSTLTSPANGGPLFRGLLNTMAYKLSDFLNMEISPVWGGGYVVTTSDSGQPNDDSEIPVYIVNSIDVPGAAAYHTRTPSGTPIIYAARDQFTDLTQGTAALTVGISHELVETIGDPGANRIAVRADGVTAEALELCDRVQGATVDLWGMSFTNFLLPSAFSPGSKGPFDRLGLLTGYDDVTPQGYAIMYNVNQPGQAQAVGPGVPKLSAKSLQRKRLPLSRTYQRGVRL